MYCMIIRRYMFSYISKKNRIVNVHTQFIEMGNGQLLAGQLLVGQLRADTCSLGQLLARTFAR